MPEGGGSSAAADDPRRTIGLLGATGVGVGAIVGGGILVLAGAAFQAAGPGALLAFALNGLVAFVTAMSVAEMSTSFPRSGGAYQFAKRVVSVRAAFATGWILWFAYIVAGALYALGFGAYAAAAIARLAGSSGTEAGGLAPARWGAALGAAATIAYTVLLTRRVTGSGAWATWGKVIFIVLIAAGAVAVGGEPCARTGAAFTPFLPGGFAGLLEAMGFTFIAVQGFELVSTIAGEVRRPAWTIPRAMFLSLAAAFVIYLALLFVMAAAVPEGETIRALAAREPDTIVATAVRHYMGPAGYWFVIVAALLSTLTALEACLLAASRVVQVMAQDRTLPSALARLDPRRQTPVSGALVSAAIVLALTLSIPTAGDAGAAASLIFFLSFALAHGTCALMRRRGGGGARDAFRTPFFPAFPALGGLACLGLAVFQGIAVPAAGVITAIWLAVGLGLYVRLFALRAEAIDAFSAAQDPEVSRLRGRRPLVLAPIANPESAQAILREALSTSLAAGWTPETLMTVALDPWAEIGRVARVHDCEVLLQGRSPPQARRVSRRRRRRGRPPPARGRGPPRRRGRPTSRTCPVRRAWAARLLGLRRQGARQKTFGPVALRVAAEAPCPVIVISQGG